MEETYKGDKIKLTWKNKNNKMKPSISYKESRVNNFIIRKYKSNKYVALPTIRIDITNSEILFDVFNGRFFIEASSQKELLNKISKANKEIMNLYF